MMATELAASYARCRELHRAHGRTYYLATRLLPRWKQRHVHALYGFMRYTDDIVDVADGRAARLGAWTSAFWSALDGGPVTGPDGGVVDYRVLPAIRDTVERFALDRADLAAFLRSMAMDLTVTEYATYDDLLGYMDGSAAAVGTLMLPILGAGTGTRERGLDPDELAAAREPARQLGLAFQLTNFIRDVGEDLARGRLYLPAKDLAEFGVDRADLAAGTVTGAARRLVAFEVGRARAHYARAAAGVVMLPPSSQRCIRTAFRLYGGILDEVRRADYDVFVRRATVPDRRRVAVAVASLLTPAGHPVHLPSTVDADEPDVDRLVG
jgi:phytoene synthase